MVKPGKEKQEMLEVLLSLLPTWQFKLFAGCYVYALASFLWIIVSDISLMDENIGVIVKKYPDLGLALGMNLVLMTHVLAAFVAKCIFLIV